MSQANVKLDFKMFSFQSAKLTLTTIEASEILEGFCPLGGGGRGTAPGLEEKTTFSTETKALTISGPGQLT